MENTHPLTINTHFEKLRKLNVNDHIEKKGSLSYLSWAWAVDALLQHDPTAQWEFDPPQPLYGDTLMVFCRVTAFGKTMKMHLPVMDNKNNAVKNPDARKISDAMMRCLTKCIALFGIGLYIYSGEDLPEEDIEPLLDTVRNAQTLDELKNAYFSAHARMKNNQEGQALLIAIKDTKKAELEGAAHE